MKMKTHVKPLAAKAKGQPRSKKTDATPVPQPSCEHCGKPATQVVYLTIDAHWHDLTTFDADGDECEEVREIYLCDNCDYCCWDIPKRELQRLGTYFGVTGGREE